MDALTYRITVLGCRVNHAEAREIESVLATRGLVRTPQGRRADLEIVHTCSVTNAAAAKSRNAIRRAARRSKPVTMPAARGSVPTLDGSTHAGAPFGSQSQRPEVFVTGCFASTNLDDAADLTRPDLAIPQNADDGSSMIERFARRLDAWLDRQNRPHTGIRPHSGASSGKSVLPLPVIRPAARASRHVRAELRIQDGCDAHCTFCIIPSIRKTLRSKTIPDALDEARRLVDLGHREIVLTGIFIGAYGHETALRRRQRRPDAQPLADLLDAVAQVPGLDRLRISSMEPGDVSEALLDAMVANAPVVVPHLHLPLQSGSDPVLRRMNRQYRVGDYLDMIDLVNAAITTDDGLPPAITTDIICGFPGETDDDFERTVAVARRVGFLHMHVFPYSARSGTAAARWTDRRCPPHVARCRVRRLIDLENDPETGLSISYRRRLVGRTLRVILEQPDKSDPNLMTGRSDHYALIHVRTARPRGSMVEARITSVTSRRTRGVLAPATCSLTVLR